MLFRVSLFLALIFAAAIFGFFYAWVCSTMWGLDQLHPATAIEAMNAMNRSVRNVVFAPAFFGTPVVLAAVGLWGYRLQQRAAALWMGAAALVYLVGAFLPTVMVNVPMNQALMLIDMARDNAALQQVWGDYSDRWQVWNIARTLVSGVVLLLVGAGLMASRPLAVSAQPANPAP
ncbi:MAG: anthrone oxygenase family protein [Thalassovita sp.]|jgi:uncharacterized membrane protein